MKCKLLHKWHMLEKSDDFSLVVLLIICGIGLVGITLVGE